MWGSDGGSSVSCNHADESDEDADGSQGEGEEGGDSDEEPAESEDEDDDEEQDEDEEDQEDCSRVPSPLPPYLSRAEEQKFLQNADRLLSRTLAAADAESNGITSEMCMCTIISHSL